MKKLLSKLSIPQRLSQKIIAALFILLIACNVFGLNNEIKQIKIYKLAIDHQNIGYKFEGLADILKDEKAVGYFTDEDLSTKEHGKEFSHAQYVLAPIIVEHNNLDHQYILFVCSRDEVAVRKMKEIGAVPLFRNQFGMILARRGR